MEEDRSYAMLTYADVYVQLTYAMLTYADVYYRDSDTGLIKEPGCGGGQV